MKAAKEREKIRHLPDACENGRLRRVVCRSLRSDICNIRGLLLTIVAAVVTIYCYDTYANHTLRPGAEKR